tara:strand:+ start:1032 stop:1265 length:234 start_codon:yes stop_codon:yes gene_type:complete
MARPEQDGLILQPHAALTVVEDLVSDETCLVAFIADRHQSWLFVGGALGPEILCVPLLGETDDAVGGGEDRLLSLGT